MRGMSKAQEIIRKAMALAGFFRVLVPKRLRGLDRETARALPLAICTGVEARRLAHATTRWRDSGYDDRLFPYAWPDDDTQRNYDLYDAWMNRGYEDDSEFWPPRTRRGRLLHGRRVDGKQAVSKEGWEGYDPDRSRLTVWGINGTLHEELAERGTLGTRKVVKEASPGDPYGGPI